MLQVPCLSPPVYGHSHYKKFWLRQTEVKETSSNNIVGVEMMKSATTTTTTSTTSSSSPEAASSTKRSCGKRRPSSSQLRSMAPAAPELERIKVPVNECLSSPTSSGEIPWKKSNKGRKTTTSNAAKRGSDGSSTVSSLEGDLGVAALGGSRCLDDDKSFASMSIEDPSQEQVKQQQQQQQQLQTTTMAATQPEMVLVRHNMSSNQSPISRGEASLDCLTSKCKSADSSLLLRQDSDEEVSDSATSSTSQASDNDDTRCRTSFRAALKRRDSTTTKATAAVVVKDEKCVASVAAGCLSLSPKTRQATPASSPVELRSPGHGSSPGGMNNVSRTCKHCGTMKTPLWRNGPLGPKSLCNACGIRLRKARRSSANQEGQTTPTATTAVPGKRKHNQQQAEATTAAATTTTTTTTFLGGLPYKKSRVAFKRESQQGEQGFIAAKLSLLGSKSLSTDEEEGAVLLMALSCGLVLA